MKITVKFCIIISFLIVSTFSRKKLDGIAVDKLINYEDHPMKIFKSLSYAYNLPYTQDLNSARERLSIFQKKFRIY